jgi:hypothetical protein
MAVILTPHFGGAKINRQFVKMPPKSAFLQIDES